MAKRQSPQSIELDEPFDGLITRPRAMLVGTGQASAHHGEILQGVFEGDDGRLHRGLVTLPLASLKAVATFWPRQHPGIQTRPTSRTKAARAAELTLEHLGATGGGGDLTIESVIPIGHGYGSSTADVIATIRAVAAAAGVTLHHSTVARLAVAAEGASDAIGYGEWALLFAHREGRVIEHFGGEFPPLVVVGFRDSKDPPIDTLGFPRARYDTEEIETFRVLRGLACRAIRQQDPRLLGHVATVSARISQRRLRKPRLDAVRQMAEDHGACGVQVAHSGTLIGILWDAGAPNTARQTAALSKKVRQAGFGELVSFALGVDGAPGK